MLTTFKSRYLFSILLLTSLIINFFPFQAKGEDSYEENDSRATATNVRKQISNYSEEFNDTHIIHQWTFSHLTLMNVTNEEDWFAFPMKLGETCFVTALIESGGSLNLELWQGEFLVMTYSTSFAMHEIVATADQNLSIGFCWLTGDPVDYSFSITEIFEYTPSPLLPLRMGWSYWFSTTAATMDPLDAWDSGSWNYIEQICEGLYAWNSVNGTYQLVPRLAAEVGTWSLDYLNYTVPLRTGVTFHDGTPFNASSVKWNFDRLYFFMNQSLSFWNIYSPLASLYPDRPFVINETQILNSTTVRFVLNYPFGAFEQLLTFYGSYIVSPASTPYDRWMLIGKDRLVGTGPYVQVLLNEQYAIFKANVNYYRPQPAVQEMHWIPFSNSKECTQALLNHSIHLINGAVMIYEANYTADPMLTYIPDQPSVSVSYLGMNNHHMNKTFRQTISYAINYTHLIEVIRSGMVSRAESYIPFGLPYYNSSIHAANCNIPMARSILIAAGIAPPGATLWTDEDWTTVALSATPFATFNYTYNYPNLWRQQLGDLLKLNLQAIGINLIVYNVTWSEYVQKLINNPEELELFSAGWVPDYADPFSSLDSLVSSLSSAGYGNIAQVNDTQLQSLLMQAISTPDPMIRQQTYDTIQTYLTTDLMPYAFLYTTGYYDVHLNWLGNFHRNPMGVLDIYQCTWNPGGSANIYIDQPTEINVTQGEPFTLNWKPYLYGSLTPAGYEIRDVGANTIIFSNDSYINATSIEYSHPGLMVGNYSFKITVTTVEDINASCTILVHVSLPEEVKYIYISQWNLINVIENTAFTLEWTPFLMGDLTPSYYEIYELQTNTSIVTYELYSNASLVTFTHPGLASGLYYFQITFYTLEGMWSSCIINVQVTTSPIYSLTIDQPSTLTVYSHLPFNLSWEPFQTGGLTSTYCEIWDYYADQLLMTTNYTFVEELNYGHSALPAGGYAFRAIFYTAQGVSNSCIIYVTVQPSYFYVTIPTALTVNHTGDVGIYYTTDITPGLIPTIIHVYWQNWSINTLISFEFGYIRVHVPTVGTYIFHVVFNTTQGVSTTIDIQITATASTMTSTTTSSTTPTTSTTTSTTSETPTNPFTGFISGFSPLVLLFTCAIITGVLISFTRKKFR